MRKDNEQAFPASSNQLMPTVRRTISLVIFPDFQLLDAAGPIAAFEVASRFVPDAYTLRLTACSAGRVPSSSGIALDAEQVGRLAGVDTVLVVGGFGSGKAREDLKLLQFLRKAAGVVPRMASVCSGALVLAEAGLLDGRRVTTHWSRIPEMRQRYPSVHVEDDRLWMRDGSIWTSAGISAGIDLALAIITQDLGPSVARDVARQLVMTAPRPSGQTQRSRLLELGLPDGRFAELNAWMQERLDCKLSVGALAAQVKMSPRTFARAYATDTGLTPAKAVERLRIEAARALIEGGGLDLQDVARRTGFGEVSRMRRAFVRLLGIPPSALLRSRRAAGGADRVQPRALSEACEGR